MLQHVSIVNSFLMLNNIFFCIDIPQLIHSLHGHLLCFQYLAITNKAAVCIHEEISVLTCAFISLGKYLGVEWLDHMIGGCLTL